VRRGEDLKGDDGRTMHHRMWTPTTILRSSIDSYLQAHTLISELEVGHSIELPSGAEASD
jgi:hypothetical protein